MREFNESAKRSEYFRLYDACVKYDKTFPIRMYAKEVSSGLMEKAESSKRILNDDFLKEVITDLIRRCLHGNGGSSKPRSATITLKYLDCVDDTDNPEPGKEGKDEISMFGVYTHPDGTMNKGSLTNLGSYRNGDYQSFNLQLQSYAFQSGSAPWLCTASIVLVEVDKGSLLPSLLDIVYDFFKDDLEKLITDTAKSIADGVEDQVLKGLILVVGQIVNVLTGYMITYIIGGFQDEIFEPQGTSLAVLGSSSVPFTKSVPLSFIGFKGEYQMGVEWSVI